MRTYSSVTDRMCSNFPAPNPERSRVGTARARICVYYSPKDRASNPDPATCHVCGATALYKRNGKGACRTHKAAL